MAGDRANLWWATAPDRPLAPELGPDERTAVAVIGGGIMGAAAALRLAQAGIATMLVEAGRIGEGASSRPGGFVVPHFSVGRPDHVIARVGELGPGLAEAVGGSAARVFDLIRSLGIECEARQGGWYHPAHDAAAMAQVEAIAAQWDALGFPGCLLGPDETARRTGARGYAGAWFAPSGGTLHPLLYCRGLADAAAATGAALREGSPVRSIVRAGGGYRLLSDRGTLTAERVIVCTNAGALAPRLARQVVPLPVWQCATEPMAANEIAHLFQAGEALSDTRRNLFTYRIDGAGRIITGALDAWGVSGGASGRRMARRLARMLDLPRVPRIDHLWSGASAVSADRLPAMLVEEDGLLAATSCNARGIALSTVVGEALADYVATGRRPPIPLLTDRGKANARTQRALRGLYPHLAPILDWIGSRQRKPA